MSKCPICNKEPNCIMFDGGTFKCCGNHWHFCNGHVKQGMAHIGKETCFPSYLSGSNFLFPPS